MLIVSLALRDLLRDRLFLICNVAVMVGVLVPLLLLFGVKNGVYQALIGEMLANPATRQIDTRGNATLLPDDIARLEGWPEIAFLTPRPRSQFDLVTLRKDGGRRLAEALVVPTGQGDPTLAALDPPGPGAAAVSALLATQLELAAGDRVQIVARADGRAPLLLVLTVAGVLPAQVTDGRSLLVPFATVDLIEAYYDSYALPDHGVADGRPLSDRAPAYSGLRVYARDLESLAPLQARIESELGIGTSARTREVESLLGLGRKLDLALGLTASLAALGLAAALVFGFWSDVARKRGAMATIALLGVPGRRLALFPVVQAAATAGLGLAASFALYGGAARAAERLFGGGLPGGASIAVLPLAQGLAIAAGVLGLVLASASLAAWSALRMDPASVLREGG